MAQVLAYSADLANRVMPLYIESARNYAHLAAGALAVSIAFREKVLGQTGGARPTIMLAGSWLCLLVTIGASAWYQYVAVKVIDLNLMGIARGVNPRDLSVAFPLTQWWLWPGYAYGAMVLSFFLGASLFVVGSVAQMMSGRPR